MRLLPGQPTHIANHSIDSLSLMRNAVSNPDVLPTVFELFKDEYTPLTTLLNVKGMKTKGLYDGFSGANYKVVKSNVVQYLIKHSDRVKLHFAKGPGGVTFECDAYPTQPGRNQSIVYCYFDTNWAGPKEVIELNDNETKIYIIDDQPPVEVGGAWRHMVKIVTSTNESFINPELMEENSEASVVHTMYEHDFSETGNEKYTFDSYGQASMTLQRLKYSYSGTAEHLAVDKYWTMHKGHASWLTYAEKTMMERAAKYHEYATIFGKGTVATDGTVLMKDKQGREILSGDGIIYQGDGAYEYPYNTWTMKFLEAIMEDADLRAGSNGKLELAVIAGQKAINGFSKLMRESGFVTQNNNVVGDAETKGVNNDYDYYEFGGVRIIPKRWRWFDSEERPHKELSDGTRKGSWDAIFVPLGKTSSGDNQIELVQLRPPKSGAVHGINKGGSEMSNSVDGSHHHFLFQSGVISRAKIQRIFRPYNS
jgi:hypothetical protein